MDEKIKFVVQGLSFLNYWRWLEECFGEVAFLKPVFRSGTHSLWNLALVVTAEFKLLELTYGKENLEEMMRAYGSELHIEMLEKAKEILMPEEDFSKLSELTFNYENI